MPLSSILMNDGLMVRSYLGDSAVLLAFNLDENKIDNLAGFSIKCKAPRRGPHTSDTYWLKNRLNLKKEITKDTQTSSDRREGSDKAPFQTFHWIHFPGAGPGKYHYTVYASYFNSNDIIKLGPKITVEVDLNYKSFSGLELGFTRGYISSQAYADLFSNKRIEPKHKSINFSTKPYLRQYEWLGAHARKIIFDFLKECLDDKSIEVDVFTYDFDEPDIIRALCRMQKRVRVFQDNSESHTDPGSMELEAIRKLKKANVKVKTGNFNRFQHNKVMIQKRKGKAVKVLTGSANFSLRGVYVQANSVLNLSDADVADLYEQAFEQAFSADERNFKSSKIASKWYDIKENTSRPSLSLSFAPHQKAFSIDKVAESIKSSKSSVFFSIMQMTGGGDLMPLLKNLKDRKDKIFSIGTTESNNQEENASESEKLLRVFRPDMDDNAAIVPFAYLKENIPKQFKDEWSGGKGHVIHHKFVVCDFNHEIPVVFCGSSNLSSGGEESNGDNLIAIYDDKIASLYAVEAIRLFDHYRFRNVKQKSTKNEPLILKRTDEWTKRYYDRNDIKFLERRVLIGQTT